MVGHFHSQFCNGPYRKLPEVRVLRWVLSKFLN
jgi:hypothetical protein